MENLNDMTIEMFCEKQRLLLDLKKNFPQ
uniref:Uncharacterized protein n=1 Tax=Rhizophora mucronata TaxID=61149 RepID=A0A2P2QZR9_RHIMU